MTESERLIAALGKRGRVPIWAWERLARELLAEGRRGDLRACALDGDALAEQRVAYLRILGAPRDPAMVEAVRGLLEHDRPWIVYSTLEGLVAAGEPCLDEVVREFHHDERRVCDLWFEDRVSHVAARAVSPSPDWLAARRSELHGAHRFMALRILARLGDTDALNSLATEPDDGFGEVDALRAELGIVQRP